MHRALLISEVLGEICRHLDEDSLAMLSRTCRTIHPELNGFRPVVLCLPDHCWVDDDKDFPMEYIGLTPADWKILAKYTARVRTLDCCLDSTVNEAELSVFATRAIQSHEFLGVPLFPSLKTLHWFDDHPELFPLSYLAGPSLVNLSIAFTHRGSLDAELLLGSLESLFPNLKNLEIMGLDCKVRVPEALWVSLHHLRRLEVFRCYSRDVGADEWLDLGQLPNLAEIDAYLSDSTLQELKSLMNTNGPRLFTSLRNIGVAVDDLQSVTEFLKLLQVSPVSLDIHLHHHATTETISSFFSQFCKHNISQVPSIQSPSFKNCADEDITLEFTCPLGWFRSLRKLELHVPYELSDVLNAWPEFQHLELPELVNIIFVVCFPPEQIEHTSES
ncbi:hypothetical protein BJ138DRAFT_1160289 [Hygrophoropsis aurantiaca]|uniref:Uncharacterized protein n=1 Tax=Hygrophoropsis aurantiaca TaxID=72124 RepID=A0ACB8A2H5_9AGAM|nr:hypothetical protein BJ138DRAFT_1160289 [Hygrophoropsis aurantiaca]